MRQGVPPSWRAEKSGYCSRSKAHISRRSTRSSHDDCLPGGTGRGLHARPVPGSREQDPLARGMKLAEREGVMRLRCRVSR
jgi:hypothetical protein